MSRKPSAGGRPSPSPRPGPSANPARRRGSRREPTGRAACGRAARRAALAFGAGALWLLAAGCATPEPETASPAEYRELLRDRGDFRSRNEEGCEKLHAVDRVIREAIQIGAPIYNAGSALGCYRIYEGAAYKLLDVLRDECPELGAFLRGGLAQAEADASVSAKAWTLRRTFDAILGKSTRGGAETF